MPDIKASDFGGSMNPSGTISGGMVAQASMQNPNIPQQQTWSNPSWMQQAGAWMNSDSMSQGMGGMMGGMSNGDMIMQADQTGGQLFGMLAGQNQSTVGNVMKSMPGMSTVGNLINAAFGSNINEEFVAQTRQGINSLRSQSFNSNTNADVLNDWRSMVTMSGVTKDEVGSDGWFSSKAKRKTAELNRAIDEANRLALLNFGHAVANADTNTDLRISQGTYAYGGPINSFRKYYSEGGYLAQAKALIRNNEGFLEKPYHDAPKGKNWRSVGYGFNDSGFREKYPEGISKHYEHGITRKQAEEELDYFLNRAEKTLKDIYGKQWNNFTDNEKAAILDTYYQRPASVGKSSRFYKAVTAGEDAGKYLGVAGFTKRNNIRQNVFGGGQYNFTDGNYSDNPDATSSFLQEETILPVVQGLDLSDITPTEVKALELDLTSPTFDLSMFGKPMTTPTQQAVPTVGTVEDFLASYGDFEENLFEKGGSIHIAPMMNLYYKGGPKYKKSEQAYYDKNTDTVYAPDSLGEFYHHEMFHARPDSAELVRLRPYYDNLNDNRLLELGADLPFVKRIENDPGYFYSPEEVGARVKAARHMLNNAGVEKIDNSFLKEARKNENAYGNNFRDLLHMYNDDNLIGIFENKHSLGGPLAETALNEYRSEGKIHIAPSKKGTFIAAASKYGLGGNLFDNGGWMDFFNAWNQAQGGNNYFANMGGSQWKPSDGFQVSSGNGNVGDWIGQATTAVNTLSNWGNEDPTLGRGGDYSQFGMAAYDLMKTIRDATKSRRESIDQKLGIPIYASGGRLFDDGGSVGAMGYAQIGNAALKLASNAKYQAGLDPGIDEGKIQRSINRYGMSFDDDVANVNTNGDLLDLWANYNPIVGNLSMRDFRDRSLFDDFLNGYAASWEGFNAGKNFGPWGAAIGAFVGGASSNIAALIGRNKASNAADENNERVEKANERMLANLEYAAGRVDRENDLRILQNMDAEYTSNAADGGKLNMGFGLRNPFIMPNGTTNPLYKAFGGGLTHGADWDTGINWVNEGGSHGENPLGGVPMGMDEQGIPNLVEEGEAIWNGDYVFSKRMKVPKKLREKYSLPDDATFADAVAKLTKDSEERPLSSIDRATNDHILGEFADIQEEMRMAKAQRAMDRERQLRDDFLTGFNMGAFGGSLFSDGGGIHIDPSKKGTFKAQASKMGMGVQEAASHILANKEDYSPAMVKKANFAKNFAHAGGGSLFTNPFEPNVFDDGGSKSKKKTSNRGKIVPFAYDWYRSGSDGYSTPTGFKVGKNGRAYDYTKEYTDLVNKLGADDIRKWATEHPNDPSLKSFLARGNKLEDLTDEQWRKGATDNKYGFMHHVADSILKDDFAPAAELPEQDPELVVDYGDPEVRRNVEAGLNPDGTRPATASTRNSTFNPRATWMRQVPIWMSGLAALRGELTPADYTNADAIMGAAYAAGRPVSVGTEYIGDYRKRDPFDERFLMNMISQRGLNTGRNIMNLSGGNRAVGMAGLFANDLTTQMSMAEAARQGYLANRTDDAQVSKYNRGTNLANMQAQNTRNLTLANLNSHRQQAMLSGIAQGARLRQAIKDQRDAAISANWTNFAQNMGDWGKENGFYNMLGGLNDEGILKYFYGDDWRTKFNNVNV